MAEEDRGGREGGVKGVWGEEVEGGVIGAASTWGRGRRAPSHTVNYRSRGGGEGGVWGRRGPGRRAVRVRRWVEGS